jgi:hypothetical protein
MDTPMLHVNCPASSLAVLVAIDEHLARRGQSPTRRELDTTLGGRTADRHLDVLARHGLITRGGPRLSRTIAITRFGRRMVDEFRARAAA